MNLVLFSVGIVVFMISVYGVVMAGGFKLWKIRREDAAPNAEFVVNDDGWEIIVTRPHAASNTTTEALRDQRPRAA